MRLAKRLIALLCVGTMLVAGALPTAAAEKQADAKAKGKFTGSNALSQYLYGKFEGGPTTLSVPKNKLGGGSPNAMFEKLGDAAEEAFVQSGMVDHVLSFAYQYSGGNSVELTLKYADKNAANRKKKATALSAKADELLGQLIKAEMTDEQKAAAIYTYLSQNVSYDYAALNDFLEKESGAGYYVKQTAHSALVNKKAICQGFAKAYKLLCDRAGVRCIVVFGTTKRAGGGDVAHAWNRVYLDGRWHTVDTTNPQLNICAQNGMFIPSETAKQILKPNKQWMIDKELSKFTQM